MGLKNSSELDESTIVIVNIESSVPSRLESDTIKVSQWQTLEGIGTGQNGLGVKVELQRRTAPGL